MYNILYTVVFFFLEILRKRHTIYTAIFFRGRKITSPTSVWKEHCSMIVWHEKVAECKIFTCPKMWRKKKSHCYFWGEDKEWKVPKTHRDDCHMEGLFETGWWCTKCYMNTKQLTCSRNQTWISHMPVSGLTQWANHPSQPWTTEVYKYLKDT